MKQRGYSKDKFCKGTGRPKMSGNYSEYTLHHLSLQSKDYEVHECEGTLIVGDHTLLSKIMPSAIVELALTDPHFGYYVREGYKMVYGKKYEVRARLTKHHFKTFYAESGWFVYREEIYTDGDFDYNFPEY